MASLDGRPCSVRSSSSTARVRLAFAAARVMPVICFLRVSARSTAQLGFIGSGAAGVHRPAHRRWRSTVQPALLALVERSRSQKATMLACSLCRSPVASAAYLADTCSSDHTALTWHNAILIRAPPQTLQRATTPPCSPRWHRTTWCRTAPAPSTPMWPSTWSVSGPNHLYQFSIG